MGGSFTDFNVLKESTSEDNRKLVENALTTRNSAARINRISKVSKGELIIETPSLRDLEALEADISCVPSLGDHFEVSKPKRRRPQVIILGIPNDVDKDRLFKGLMAKYHFMYDSKNQPLFEVNFSIRARFSTNWIISVDRQFIKDSLMIKDFILSSHVLNSTTSLVSNSADIAAALTTLPNGALGPRRNLGLNGSFDLLVGDLNARSQIWGYDFEDHRGQIISEFIASNNFSICNRMDLGPTFVPSNAEVFPDVTLLSTAHQDLLDSWRGLDQESLSDHKVIEFPDIISDIDFDVYTDGSGIDGNVGASAELAAINFSAGWALENNDRINIFTDSFSSIEVLKTSNSKSNYINVIKNNMFRTVGSVGLSWVKAHVGTLGNELADQLAKEATTDGVLLSLPAPYSFLSKFINSYIVDNWQRHWGNLKTELGSGSLSHLWIQLF
ncbi:hypothetical protein AVEN_79295-1 [Araneus ventricosus]|uniref:RNase H type-1 domain-containing protein n=1 Tax=Araneus ventricosus TaxID=182803 RepID=A0A4Y2Q129_ARAVE|nr:hypothetical protein AVEN_79295-1 [Araneus ventricosus]